MHNLLKDFGISGVLSLCDQKEVAFSALLENKFKHCYFPIPDHSYGIDPSIEQVLEALKKIYELRDFGPVFVHCYAGVERSPLICMAWLITQHQLSPQRALDYLMDIHPRTNPLPSQFKLLYKIKNI